MEIWLVVLLLIFAAANILVLALLAAANYDDALFGFQTVKKVKLREDCLFLETLRDQNEG